MITTSDKRMTDCRIGSKRVFAINIGDERVWNKPHIAVKITTATADKSVRIFPTAYQQACYIDWGDGSTVEYQATGSTAHVFAAIGTYNIKVYIEGYTSGNRFLADTTILSSLREVDFSSPRLTNIERYACGNSTALTYVNISCGNVVNMQGGASAGSQFRGCTNLIEFNWTNGSRLGTMENVSDFLRGASKLTRFEIPQGSVCPVFGVNDNFRDCTRLTDFFIRQETFIALTGSGNFSGTPCNFYVPANLIETYKTATGWSAFADRIFEIGG